MTMRRPAGFTTRRHRPSAPAIAFSHASTMTFNTTVAESVAAAAIRRGAHSRTAIVAHARHQSLEHARHTPVATSADTPAALDLKTLAMQLAATRPPLERAIVDLELRYGLDPSSFARVLGLTNHRAEQRSATVSQTWADALDPAVMAWLGPASCENLAAVLTEARLWPRSADAPVVSSVDSTGPVPVVITDEMNSTTSPDDTSAGFSNITVATLLEVAPSVRAHAASCSTCGERLRMLTPVRTLVGQLPLEIVPQTVAEAAKTAYRRIPTPLPPSIEPHRIDLSRLRVPAFTVAALALVLTTGFILVNRNDDSEPSQADRVAKLVDAAPPSNLLATPSVITSDTRTASLANNSEDPVDWNATANVPWISVRPSTGNLRPTQSVTLALEAEEPAGNHTDADIVITGSDGSRQVLHYSAAH
jgi:hypothetical protein